MWIRESKFYIMLNKKWMVLLPLLLLLLPLIGMFISDEINWSVFDFIIMGVLILSLSLSIKLFLNSTKKLKYRFIGIGFILLVFLMIWADLAVRIFGTPFCRQLIKNS
jgi:bacteriorhodopsin